MLKRLTVLFFLVFLPLQAETPVKTHGSLVADGNKIIGSIDKKPAQVAGMSMYWTAWGGEKFYTRGVVESLVDNWNATLVRAAMTVAADWTEGYVDNPDGQKLMVKTIIDAAIRKGIYVIVDWHDHDANLHVENAKTFFGQLAQEYGNTPNIIWEIWNEPDAANGTGKNNYDSWEDIKKYANEVIPVIREHSKNLIVVGTPIWSQAVNEAADDPLDFENIAYTLHFYAGSHGDSLRMKADYALENGVALFITEFGLTMANGNDGVFTDSTKKWLDWADENGISWANWSLSSQSESSAALTGTASTDGNWTDADLSESGKWIKARLLTRPEYDKPIIDTLSIPRIVEAESFVKVSENGPQAENPGGVSGGGSLGYTKPGCWAEYAITVQEGSTFKAIARVASGDGSNGGTITAKIADKVVATWNIQNTGGWQTWILADSSTEFELEPGKYTLRVEWSGEGESLVNLDYIEFISTQTKISYHRPKLSKKNIGIKITKKDGFVLLNTTKEMKTVSLFTINGRQAFCSPVQSGKMQIPLKNGLYLLNIKNHDGKATILPISGF